METYVLILGLVSKVLLIRHILASRMWGSDVEGGGGLA